MKVTEQGKSLNYHTPLAIAAGRSSPRISPIAVPQAFPKQAILSSDREQLPRVHLSYARKQPRALPVRVSVGKNCVSVDGVQYPGDRQTSNVLPQNIALGSLCKTTILI